MAAGLDTSIDNRDVAGSIPASGSIELTGDRGLFSYFDGHIVCIGEKKK